MYAGKGYIAVSFHILYIVKGHDVFWIKAVTGSIVAARMHSSFSPDCLLKSAGEIAAWES